MKKHLLLSSMALALMGGISQAQTVYQWADRMGSTGYDHVSSVAVDASGNAYVTGSFEGTVDFDPGPSTANLTAAGAHDVFIAKYSASGAYQWAMALGGNAGANAWSEGLKIAVTPGGNVVVAGYFVGITDFDPGSGTVSKTATTYGELFVASYDASGNYQWVNTTGGWSVASALTVDLSGNIYVAGVLNTTGDFDPGPGTANLNPANGALFLVKYSSSGAYQWAKNMAPTTGSLSATGLGLDVHGNIYMTGAFNGTLNFNPGPGVKNLVPVGLQDIFLTKFDPSGNLLWAENTGCSANATIPKGLVVNPLNGSVYITGSHYTTIDLDMGPGTATFNTHGNYNVFLAKYDSTGAYQWGQSFGGASNTGGCDGTSLALATNGDVMLGGYYSQTVDFDPGSGTSNLSSVYPDIFVARYTSAGAYVWAKSLHAPHAKVFNPGISDAKIALDYQGNMYVAGTFADTVDFGMGATGAQRTSAGHYDAYLAKYSTSPTAVGNTAMQAAAFQVYPNPAKSGSVTISYTIAKTGIAELQIFDMSGKLLTRRSLNAKTPGVYSDELNIGLAPGMYTLRLMDADGSHTEKLVVE